MGHRAVACESGALVPGECSGVSGRGGDDHQRCDHGHPTSRTPGRDWPAGAMITLCDTCIGSNGSIGSFSKTSSKGPSAIAVCPIDRYGQIPSCLLKAGGSGYTTWSGAASGTIPIRWPLRGVGGYPATTSGSATGSAYNLRRDSLIERWVARPGQPYRAGRIDAVLRSAQRRGRPRTGRQQ